MLWLLSYISPRRRLPVRLHWSSLRRLARARFGRGKTSWLLLLLLLFVPAGGDAQLECPGQRLVRDVAGRLELGPGLGHAARVDGRWRTAPNGAESGVALFNLG